MAITTYTELQTAVANWMDQSKLTARIPEFISLAENKITRSARHWRMEKRATAPTVAGERSVELPSDYLEMRNLKINSTSQNVLEFLSPSVLYEGSSSQGAPSYYTIQGDQIVLEPIPDTEYTLEMGYYAFDVLSDSNTTNWLLTTYPDAYLYGTLIEASAYMRSEFMPVWVDKFNKVMEQIKKDDKAARWNGTPLIIRAQP